MMNSNPLFAVYDYKINFDIMLGKGCQGQIYQCQKISTQEEIVAKVTKVNFLNANTIEREIAIVNKIKQQQNVQNLVKMYDIVLDEYNGEKILVEFMEKCDSDLGKLIKEYQQNNRSFTFQQVIDFAGQIIRGYTHLNKSNIIHRDIKPENILITKIGDNLELKITDFGVGKVLTNDYAITNTGTPIYSAPELTCSDQAYTSKADIFSLGVILYQLTYNTLPFKVSGKSVQIVKQSLKTQPIICQNKEGFEAQFLDLIDRMLRFSPHDRINWDQLENHEYFRNYFPENCSQNNLKQIKQLHEYMIAVYYQTSKIIQIVGNLPKEFKWQNLAINLTKYILINFQNELIQIILSIKNNKSEFNKSIVTVSQQQVDQKEIQQALDKNNILDCQTNNDELIKQLKQEIEDSIPNLEDIFFQDFYKSLINIPVDESIFDFWHLKFQIVYKTQIRQWLSKYLVQKQVTITYAYLLEKFSYLLVEYPKTSYNNFQYNQIHSKIIQQDTALEYLKQKQLI
ncbi:unnamed protein product (macronuclear) [Paramecium tetraurelia]|uniref:Protein kinase domain-containing protein n=1 Tax=Paramecium tetraurelia TaxID=5888 RepID=A0DH25_PARTE|nr:uncharacterized protein GSPATT00016728001 [Paramecium tetraurelia]CAK82342.1 unnamed protein product [Paramecium tetraurelia]|eukprot:XP_001449739.1 hypothetical protein (macronuclear) [Paramecium tetraurelia strain d4-2]